MHDRFKFRFFETYNNTMLDCDDYDIDELLEEGKPVMQCTGLKDKNGKLIYEGDIVKMPYIEPILNYMPSEKCTELAKIEEFKGCFTILYADKSQRTYLYQWDNKIEVIGNIYENPELLED